MLVNNFHSLKKFPCVLARFLMSGNERLQMTDISGINMGVYRSVFANAAIWSRNEIDWTIM